MEPVRLVEQQLEARDIWRLRLHAPAIVRVVRPGQFVQIRTAPGMDPLLRRPFSLHDWDRQQGYVDLLYQVRGRGTGLMAQWQAGQEVDLFGPLGNGFQWPDDPGRALLVGGGLGVAPLVGLARELTGQGWQVAAALGAPTAVSLVGTAALVRLGVTVHQATDDGSLGLAGPVTVLLQPLLATASAVFSCGPRAMLREVAAVCQAAGLPCQVSVDTRMACGVGACLGCVVLQPSGRYARACVEGPVFAAGEVAWNE